MTIKDLKNVGASLHECGRIRLGGKKVSSSGKEYPTNLDYFRIDDTAPEIYADMVAAFGEQPQRLPGMLLHPTVDRLVISHHEIWSAGGLKCRGDGVNVIKMVDPETQMLHVSKGFATRDYRDGDLTLGPDYTHPGLMAGQVPCPGFERNLYPRCVNCKPSALFKVMIRDGFDSVQPIGGVAGYHVITTHSRANIETIYSRLNFIDGLMSRSGGGLIGIPIILARVSRPMDVQGKDGKMAKRDIWLMDIQLDFKTHQVLTGRSLTTAATMTSLPAIGHEEVYSVDNLPIVHEIEAEVSDEQEDRPEEPPPPSPDADHAVRMVKAIAEKRPRSALNCKLMILHNAAAKEKSIGNPTHPPSQKQTNYIASMMSTAFKAGGDRSAKDVKLARYSVLRWLFFPDSAPTDNIQTGDLKRFQATAFINFLKDDETTGLHDDAQIELERMLSAAIGDAHDGDFDSWVEERDERLAGDVQ